MAIVIGIRKAIIPEHLKTRVAQLSEETKELALAYIVARHTPDGEEFDPAMFHGDLAVNAWEALKDRGLKFEDR